MDTKQGLYAQVVMLRQKNLKSTEGNKNKNEAKFKFQGQSARSQRWFDLDFDWNEVNFSTSELDLYRKLFQRHDDKKDTNKFQTFQVPIVTSSFVEKSSFTVMP